MDMLELCTELDISGMAKSRGVDLYTTLSVYNLHHWFDGYRAVVVLDLYDPAIAIVDIGGRAIIASSRCINIDTYIAKLIRVLGLEEDLTEFHSIAIRDVLLSSFVRTWSGWRLRSCDLWWAIVIGVCQQNASFRQGWSMLLNIVNLYGRRVWVESFGEVVLPPRPEDIVRDPSKLSIARVGYRARAIESIARSFLNRLVPPSEALEKMGSREVEYVLRSLRGVGSYTARLAMVLAFRRYELPPVDKWLRAIVSRVYGVDERYAERKWVEIWGRWSGLAAIALTIALDAAPLRDALSRIERGELVPKLGNEPSPATLWRFTQLTTARTSRAYRQRISPTS